MSHEWGPYQERIDMDVSKCLRCGLIRSNAQIHSTASSIPPCRKPK